MGVYSFVKTCATPRGKLHKAYVFLVIPIRFKHMPDCKHSPDHKNEAIGFKHVRIIASISCTSKLDLD